MCNSPQITVTNPVDFLLPYNNRNPVDLLMASFPASDGNAAPTLKIEALARFTPQGKGSPVFSATLQIVNDETGGVLTEAQPITFKEGNKYIIFLTATFYPNISGEHTYKFKLRAINNMSGTTFSILTGDASMTISCTE